MFCTVKSLIVAAATIDFERFQRPFLLSKLKELTKGAATIRGRPLLATLRYIMNYGTSSS